MKPFKLWLITLVITFGGLLAFAGGVDGGGGGGGDRISLPENADAAITALYAYPSILADRLNRTFFPDSHDREPSRLPEGNFREAFRRVFQSRLLIALEPKPIEDGATVERRIEFGRERERFDDLAQSAQVIVRRQPVCFDDNKTEVLASNSPINPIEGAPIVVRRWEICYNERMLSLIPPHTAASVLIPLHYHEMAEIIIQSEMPSVSRSQAHQTALRIQESIRIRLLFLKILESISRIKNIVVRPNGATAGEIAARTNYLNREYQSIEDGWANLKTWQLIPVGTLSSNINLSSINRREDQELLALLVRDPVTGTLAMTYFLCRERAENYNFSDVATMDRVMSAMSMDLLLRALDLRLLPGEIETLGATLTSQAYAGCQVTNIPSRAFADDNILEDVGVITRAIETAVWQLIFAREAQIEQILSAAPDRQCN